MRFFKRFRKINFEKDKLVICKLGIIQQVCVTKVSETNNLFNDLDYNTCYEIIPKARILIEYYGRFYEPNTFYSFNFKFYSNVKALPCVGDVVVVETDKKPIQYCDSIKLTESEKQSKKISIKRIENLEKSLNV